MILSYHVLESVLRNALIPCRTIGGILPKRNDTTKALVVEDTIMIFTPAEYRLLCVLLDDGVVEDKKLIETLFATRLVDKTLLKTLDRHIENAKIKLRSSRLSIRRVHRYGYSLVETNTT